MACHREAVRWSNSRTIHAPKHQWKSPRSIDCGLFCSLSSDRRVRVLPGTVRDGQNHFLVDVLNLESLTADCDARAGVVPVAEGRVAVFGPVAAACGALPFTGVPVLAVAAGSSLMVEAQLATDQCA